MQYFLSSKPVVGTGFITFTKPTIFCIWNFFELVNKMLLNTVFILLFSFETKLVHPFPYCQQACFRNRAQTIFRLEGEVCRITDAGNFRYFHFYSGNIIIGDEECKLWIENKPVLIIPVNSQIQYVKNIAHGINAYNCNGTRFSIACYPA